MDATSSDPPADAPQPSPRARQVRGRLAGGLRRWVGLALGLFALTCLSTWQSGQALFGDDALWRSTAWHYGAAVMAILLAHEFGHYLQSLRYRVPATPPLFIPFPFSPTGTMGAVIVQGAGFADRKALFDIAISGPLAGLMLALPIAWWGLQGSEVTRFDGQAGVTVFGDPPILRWMIERYHGPLQPNEDVELTPLLFAGWVGIFITALNLIPVGQLDGGHILYTLIGRQAHLVAWLLVAGTMVWMVWSRDIGYLVFTVLLLTTGVRHPPTADDTVRLGGLRTGLGWLTLAFVLIGFTPRPIMTLQPVPVEIRPGEALSVSLDSQ